MPPHAPCPPALCRHCGLSQGAATCMMHCSHLQLMWAQQHQPLSGTDHERTVDVLQVVASDMNCERTVAVGGSLAMPTSPLQAAETPCEPRAHCLLKPGGRLARPKHGLSTRHQMPVACLALDMPPAVMKCSCCPDRKSQADMNSLDAAPTAWPAMAEVGNTREGHFQGLRGR